MHPDSISQGGCSSDPSASSSSQGEITMGTNASASVPCGMVRLPNASAATLPCQFGGMQIHRGAGTAGKKLICHRTGSGALASQHGWTLAASRLHLPRALQDLRTDV